MYHGQMAAVKSSPSETLKVDPAMSVVFGFDTVSHQITNPIPDCSTRPDALLDTSDHDMLDDARCVEARSAWALCRFYQKAGGNV